MKLPSTMSNESVTAAAIATLAAATAVAYFAGLAPILRSKSTYSAAQSALAEAQSQIGSLGSMIGTQQSEEARLQADLDASPVRLHPAGRINECMSQLTALAAETGIVIESLQQSPPTYKERFGTVPIRLQARGTYSQCTYFIRKITARHDLGTSAIDLSGNGSDANNSPLIVLDLLWYVAPPEQRT
ncbi:MAG: type 4a pilus biogenesis protein PilO [Phycisphaeraceae bacterium]|nr:type 4a pilus biogenesis protein PilO [Phycisphaeraceae bacterium]